MSSARRSPAPATTSVGSSTRAPTCSPPSTRCGPRPTGSSPTPAPSSGSSATTRAACASSATKAKQFAAFLRSYEPEWQQVLDRTPGQIEDLQALIRDADEVLPGFLDTGVSFTDVAMAYEPHLRTLLQEYSRGIGALAARHHGRAHQPPADRRPHRALRLRDDPAPAATTRSATRSRPTAPARPRSPASSEAPPMPLVRSDERHQGREGRRRRPGAAREGLPAGHRRARRRAGRDLGRRGLAGPGQEQRPGRPGRGRGGPRSRTPPAPTPRPRPRRSSAR